MSLDPSLRIKTGMAGKRSVLKREERLSKMMADKKFDPKKNSPLGIAKTRVGKA